MCAMAVSVLSEALLDGSGKVSVSRDSSSTEILSDAGVSLDAPVLLGAPTSARSVGRAVFNGPNSGVDGRHNVLFRSGVLPPTEGRTNIWRFHIIDGESVTLGVSREALFKDGYGCRSIGVNSVGNLASNSLLAGLFIAGPKAGDVLDLFIEREGAKLILYFTLNGQIHGSRVTLDFSMEKPSPATALDSIVPMIGFGEQDHAAVVFIEFELVPTATTAPYKSTPPPLTGPTGIWKTELPHSMELTITDENKLIAKVRNTFITNAHLLPDHTISAPGNIIATRMLGPPFENDIVQWLNGLTGKTWQLSSDDDTVLTIDAIQFTRKPPTNIITYAGDNNPLHVQA